MKVHGFINPRTGAPTCIWLVDRDERYRWLSYTHPYMRLVNCKRCLSFIWSHR